MHSPGTVNGARIRRAYETTSPNNFPSWDGIRHLDYNTSHRPADLKTGRTRRVAKINREHIVQAVTSPPRFSPVPKPSCSRPSASKGAYPTCRAPDMAIGRRRHDPLAQKVVGKHGQ
jgi:hypothetical protein